MKQISVQTRTSFLSGLQPFAQQTQLGKHGNVSMLTKPSFTSITQPKTDLPIRQGQYKGQSCKHKGFQHKTIHRLSIIERLQIEHKMKSISVLTILLYFLVNHLVAQNANIKLISQTMPVTGKDTILSAKNMAAISSKGERYVVISFKGSMSLNGTLYTSGYFNKVDHVIAKYDVKGNLLAAKQFGTITSGLSTSGIKIDTKDNLYFAVGNGGTSPLLVDNVSIPSGKGSIVKFSPDFKAVSLTPIPTGLPLTFDLDEEGNTFFLGYSDKIVSIDAAGNTRHTWLSGLGQYNREMSLAYQKGVVYSNGIYKSFDDYGSFSDRANYLAAYDTTGKQLWEIPTSTEFDGGALAVKGNVLVLAASIRNILQTKTKQTTPLSNNIHYNFGQYTCVLNTTANVYTSNFYKYPKPGSKVYFLPSFDAPSIVTIAVDARNGNYKWSTALPDTNFTSKDVSPASVILDDKANVYMATNTTAKFQGWGSYSLTPLVVKYDSTGTLAAKYYSTLVKDKFQYTPFRNNWIGLSNDSIVAFSEQLQTDKLVIVGLTVQREDVVTGLEEAGPTVSKITLYPNPVTDVIGLFGCPSARLYSLKGEMLLEIKEGQNDIGPLEKGVYLIKADDRIFKIIKR